MRKLCTLLTAIVFPLLLCGCGVFNPGNVSLTFTSPPKGTVLKVGDTIKFDIDYNFGANAVNGPYIIQVDAQNHSGSTSDCPLLYNKRFDTLTELTGTIHAEYVVEPKMIKLSLPVLFEASLLANPGGSIVSFDNMPITNYDSIATGTISDYYMGEEFAFYPPPGNYGTGTSVYLCAPGDPAIHYTIDGSDPKNSPTVKTGNDLIFWDAGTVTIRAYADVDKTIFGEPSVYTGTYVILK